MSLNDENVDISKNAYGKCSSDTLVIRFSLSLVAI